MKKILSITINLCLMIVVSPFAKANYSNNPEAQKVINELVNQNNLPRPWVEQAFQSAKQDQRALKLIQKPAEGVLQWKNYRKIFITDSQIEGGAKFWQQHAKTLSVAEKRYGVPAQVIVAIIGVETRYGRHMGSHRVIDALATLSFEYPRRAKFFQKELKEYLLLAKQYNIDPTKPVGSYTGAMGYGQFMPSSFRHYAVDYAGVKQTSIWDNVDDAIMSVGNYLASHHWSRGEKIAVQAKVSGRNYSDGVKAALKPAQTLKQLEQLGWQPMASVKTNKPVRGLRLEGLKGDEYWITLQNFYTITRYNQSSMYAMVVNQLSQLIEQQHTKSLSKNED